MSSLRDGLMILMKIAAALVAGFVLLLIAVGVWMAHSMRTAKADAEAFCASIEVGVPVAEIEARAKRGEILTGTGPEGRRRYRFPGWGQGICEVEERDGRAVSRRAWFEEFD